MSFITLCTFWVNGIENYYEWQQFNTIIAGLGL